MARTPKQAAARAVVLVCGDFAGERLDWSEVCAPLGLAVRHVPAAAIGTMVTGVMADAPVAAVVLDAESSHALGEIARCCPAAPILLAHSMHTGLEGWEVDMLPIAGTLIRPLDAAECHTALCLLASANAGAPTHQPHQPRRDNTPWKPFTAAKPPARSAAPERSGPTRPRDALRSDAPIAAHSR